MKIFNVSFCILKRFVNSRIDDRNRMVDFILSNLKVFDANIVELQRVSFQRRILIFLYTLEISSTVLVTSFCEMLPRS
jgi:hypothetical protein